MKTSQVPTKATDKKPTIPRCAAEVYHLDENYCHDRCSRQAVAVRLWPGTGRRFFVCHQHSRASFFWPHGSAETTETE